jgi:hypothetical protein
LTGLRSPTFLVRKGYFSTVEITSDGSEGHIASSHELQAALAEAAQRHTTVGFGPRGAFLTTVAEVAALPPLGWNRSAPAVPPSVPVETGMQIDTHLHMAG